MLCMIPETVGIAFADESEMTAVAEEQALDQEAPAEAVETADADLEMAAEAVPEEEIEAPQEPVLAQTSREAKAANEETPAATETPADPAQEQPAAGTDTQTQEPAQETPAEPVVIDITGATITLERTVYRYTGKEKTPAVTSLTLADGTVVDPAGYKVKYSKNTNAGTAKVKVSGIKSANVTGKAETTFTILGEVKGFEVTARKAGSLTFRWEKYKTTEARGYKIFRYDPEKKEYVEARTIKGTDKLTDKVYKLEPASKYKFKIAVYMKDPVTKEIFIGPKSDMIVGKTAPVAPKEKTKLTSLYNKKPYVQVKWKNLGKKVANVYQIQYSRDSKFKNAETVTVNTAKASSKRIYGLRSGVRYYFRIRAGKSYGGDEEYGKWSSSRSVVAYSTGWTTYKGRQYYYVNGRTLKGSQILNGNPYYFDKKTGEFHGCSSLIWNKVQKYGSKTRSIVTIDCAKHRVNVFRLKDGDWVCIKQWVCSTGQTEVNGEYKKTPKGVFKLRYKLKHFGEEKGYTCWYACNFSGNSFIHSVLYNPYSKTSIQDGRLGINASHGCVRLKLQNAKWLYDHVKKGSTIISVNGTPLYQ